MYNSDKSQTSFLWKTISNGHCPTASRAILSSSSVFIPVFRPKAHVTVVQPKTFKMKFCEFSKLNEHGKPKCVKSLQVDLPIEMWHSIFDQLSALADLAACAQVDKKFYFAVKEYRIREIAFNHLLPSGSNLFHSAPTNHQYRVELRKVSILKNPPFNFDYLKRLKIGQSYKPNLIDDINRFVHLEELDIDLVNYEFEKTRILSLANLRVLYVHLSVHRGEVMPCLKLNTPRLAKVCTFRLELLDFLYAESVRCIHTFSHGQKLSTFPNLEYLTFTDRYNSFGSSWFQRISLRTLKKLKEIDFYHHGHLCRARNLEIFNEMIAILLAKRQPNLKVFWFGVQIDRLTESERLINADSQFAFQIQNCEKLKDQVEIVRPLEFNKTMKMLLNAGLNLSEEFTAKFLAKFPFKRIVATDKVKYPELLLELIAKSPSLSSLKFKDSLLDQSFFDRMVEIVRLKSVPLQILSIKGASNDIQSFEFVCRLLDLQMFETDQKLSNEIVSNLLELPRLKLIKFFFKKIEHKIERMSRSKFRLDGRVGSLLELQKIYDPPESSKQLEKTEQEPKQAEPASLCRLL